MAKMTERDNFLYLLVALIVLLGGCAIMEQFFGTGQSVILLGLLFCMSASIFGIESQKIKTRGWLGFLIVLVMLSSLASIFDAANLSIVSLVALIMFIGQYLKHATLLVLKASNIDRNQIVGSICIYLMMGLWFTFVQLLLLELLGGGFNGIEYGPWLDNLSKMIYFSFITMTSVGYGAISPSEPLTRFVAYFQAIAGVFYLAILVSSLVSAGLSQKSSASDE
ncbi:potassium channel family protein [Vibrio neonatus]|uniref:potassium channel family protein n=1 Tax=Vibrio neonatus TaxID=278860 RepID=UPI0021C46F82|nr:potassium channel family protein [Vibrio neonatus]